MHDITDPLEELPPTYDWIWIALVLFLLALLLLLLLRRKKKKGPPPLPRLKPYLQKLDQISPTATPSTIATSCSLTLRRYLQDLKADPSLYETHEELEARSDSFDYLGIEAREHLKALLHQFNAAKYAPPQTATAANEDLIQQTKDTLKAIHSTNTTLDDSLDQIE